MTDSASNTVRGTGLLLDIVGSLLVALLVDHGSAFIQYVSQISGGAGFAPVFTAYSCFLLNIFRQVHGIVLVNDPSTRFGPLKKYESRGESVFGFFSLLFVLGIPCLLVVHMEAVSKESMGPCWFPMGIHAMWVFGAYFLTGACYVVWDALTIKMCNDVVLGGSRTHNQTPTDEEKKLAMELKGYVRRWLLGYVAALVLCVFAFIAMGVTGFKITPPGGNDGNSFTIPSVHPCFPWVVVLLTGGYTIYDYIFNRRFYFHSGEESTSAPTSSAATT